MLHVSTWHMWPQTTAAMADLCLDYEAGATGFPHRCFFQNSRAPCNVLNKRTIGQILKRPQTTQASVVISNKCTHWSGPWAGWTPLVATFLMTSNLQRWSFSTLCLEISAWSSTGPIIGRISSSARRTCKTSSTVIKKQFFTQTLFPLVFKKNIKTGRTQ